MKIKKKLLSTPAVLLFSAVLAPFGVAHASPLVSVGDQLDVFFKGSSNLSWSSNLFRDSSNEVEDLLLTVTPGFEFKFGRGVSNADFSVLTSYDILRYDKSGAWDTELFHVKALGSYSANRLTATGSASFDERQTTVRENVAPGTLVESNQTRFNVEGEYEYSPKFSVGSGVKYSDREYTSLESSYADRENFTIPVDVFYELTAKVDLSFGYQYSQTEVEANGTVSAYDVDSHFFNVGARGDLLPKLIGSFKFGYRSQDTDYSTGADKSDSSLGVDASFTYVTTPKLTNSLTLSRDFGASGTGSRVEETSANLSANYAIDSQWSALARLGYSLREYLDSSRDDSYYTAGLRVNYTPNQYWSFGGGYGYSDNDSDVGVNSFQNHKLDVSASLRY
ncbi:MAG: hypothetical protein ACI81V_000601 [Lentimonas sp.]|jgi:hypothetical protein